MATTELTGAEEVAWDLTDLFEGPDDPKLEAEVADAESAGEAFRSRHHGRGAGLRRAELARAGARAIPLAPPRPCRRARRRRARRGGGRARAHRVAARPRTCLRSPPLRAEHGPPESGG